MHAISNAPKKIFVLFNCQNSTLIASLQRLLPDSEVTGTSTNRFKAAHQSGKLDSKVDADAFVCLHNAKALLGNHPSHALLPDVPARTLLPVIFRGFHPDFVRLPTTQEKTAYFSGLHSMIVHSGYMRGASVDEIMADFNMHTYRELGYPQTFNAEQTRLLKALADDGLEMQAAYNSWIRNDIFMHTSNHPKAYVIFDLAVALCKREGWYVDPELIRYWRPLTEDILMPGLNWPVYPELAHELGFEGSYFFRPTVSSKLLKLREFIEYELDVFRQSEAA